MAVRNMARCALFAALLCICAWICVPLGATTFTLQTFALFLMLFLLGGKMSSIVCFVYLALGAIGLPVFSGFRGGLSALLDATGGYLMGFFVSALLYWGITAWLGSSKRVQIFAGIAGMVVCYLFGTLWFLLVYLSQPKGTQFFSVLMTCVVPYLLPDTIKLILAFFLSRRLAPFLRS